MTYQLKAYQGVGIDWDKVGSTVQAAAAVSQDPALSEVVCHVLRLNAITEGRNPGPVCPRRRYSPAEKQKGIGLYLAAKPLRVAVWIRQHPAVAVAGAAGVLGLVYFLGRASK